MINKSVNEYFFSSVGFMPFLNKKEMYNNKYIPHVRNWWMDVDEMDIAQYSLEKLPCGGV